jgi:hypothetical protein
MDNTSEFNLNKEIRMKFWSQNLNGTGRLKELAQGED